MFSQRPDVMVILFRQQLRLPPLPVQQQETMKIHERVLVVVEIQRPVLPPT